MLPGDLTNLMQSLSLAVAVGCGAPALIYLFTKRENRKQKLESVSVPLIQDDTKQLVPVIFARAHLHATSFIPICGSTEPA
jgi:hypothetical protein